MTARHKDITAVISKKKGRDYYYIIVSYHLSNGKRVQKWIKTEFSVNGNNKRKLEQKGLKFFKSGKTNLFLMKLKCCFPII